MKEQKAGGDKGKKGRMSKKKPAGDTVKTQAPQQFSFCPKPPVYEAEMAAYIQGHAPTKASVPPEEPGAPKRA